MRHDPQPLSRLLAAAALCSALLVGSFGHAGGFAQFRTSNQRIQFQAQQTVLDIGILRARVGGVTEFVYEDRRGSLELYGNASYYESDGSDYGLEVQLFLTERDGSLATDLEISSVIGVTW